MSAANEGSCPSAGSVLVPVRGMYLGISDLHAALFGIEEKVRTARYHVRDEANSITWVHDRLQGLTPNSEYTSTKGGGK